MSTEGFMRDFQSARTLSAVEVQDAIRRPSFELQQAAILNGYASVRDFVLAECVEEIRVLKGRVDLLEQEVDPGV